MFILIPVLGFIIFIYSIVLHEISHGWVADRLGDPTARLSGRLTLNPLSHLDPIMSILLPLFLLLSRSPVVVGAAKPVPIDPYNLRGSRKDIGLIGLAGPSTNLLLALLLALIARLITTAHPNLWQLLANATRLNLGLAVFNLIPLPPLDGGRLLIGILPRKQAEILASIENLGLFLVLFLLLFPTPLFSLQSIVLSIVNFIFFLIFPGLPLI